MDTNERIRAALVAFANQRPGLEPGNYGSWSDYRAESRCITRQLHDFNALLTRAPDATEAEWREAFRAFSGRLTLETHAECSGCGGIEKECYTREDGSIGYRPCSQGRMRLSYCTGQYFPTEYRAAACAVVASLIWSRTRESCPDAATLEPFGLSPGSWIRCRLAAEFGWPLARRWLDADQRAAGDMARFRRWQNSGRRAAA